MIEDIDNAQPPPEENYVPQETHDYIVNMFLSQPRKLSNSQRIIALSIASDWMLKITNVTRNFFNQQLEHLRKKINAGQIKKPDGDYDEAEFYHRLIII